MKRTLIGLTSVHLVALLAVPHLAAAQPARPQRPPETPQKDVGAETASHKELKPLDITFQRLAALRLHTDGDLLAADAGAKEIKVISPAGKQVAAIKPGFSPVAIAVAADGTIYCGGDGQLAKLTKAGEILKKVSVPDNIASAMGQTGRRARDKPPSISGIAVSDKDVFAAFASGRSTRSKSKLFRFDLDWGNPTVLAEGLRGCCRRCDLVVRDGVIYLAENAVHRVVLYDRDGKVLGKWGQRSRTGLLEGFGSCCNPMNLSFGDDGALYTAESGMGRVKRYSTKGKFLGLVGYVGVRRFTRASRTAAACSNIAIVVTPGGQRVYVMDLKANQLRVLEKKG